MNEHYVGRRRPGVKLRRPSAIDRALIALELVRGERGPKRRHREARALTGASSGYLGTAASLTADELELVETGVVSLAAMHERGISDERLARIIERAGVDRVWSVLDRLTAPLAQAAE